MTSLGKLNVEVGQIGCGPSPLTGMMASIDALDETDEGSGACISPPGTEELTEDADEMEAEEDETALLIELDVAAAILESASSEGDVRVPVGRNGWVLSEDTEDSVYTTYGGEVRRETGLREFCETLLVVPFPNLRAASSVRRWILSNRGSFSLLAERMRFCTTPGAVGSVTSAWKPPDTSVTPL